MSFRPIVFAAALLASGIVAAQAPLSLGQAQFEEQRAQIEADLADGETYSEISNQDRATVREALERIGSELVGVDSIDELSEEDKVRVFNDQELVNNILTEAARHSRVICTREAATGTRFHKTRCYTVAERERRREADQADLRRSQNGIGQRNN